MLADYRGQDAAHDRAMAFNEWTHVAMAPTDAEPYRLTRIGLAWVLSLPGAPVLFAGDEFGQWGGGGLSNITLMRSEAMLSAAEIATLAIARQLGMARSRAPRCKREPMFRCSTAAKIRWSLLATCHPDKPPSSG